MTFRGHVAHEQLLGELDAGAYDAVILTSIELGGGLMEGIPVALMEAMARRVPVIATDSGSIGELVDDECGRLVDPRNVTAIAAAVAELADDPALRDRLAEAAYEKIRKSFEVGRVMRELAGLIGARHNAVTRPVTRPVRCLRKRRAAPCPGAALRPVKAACPTTRLCGTALRRRSSCTRRCP